MAWLEEVVLRLGVRSADDVEAAREEQRADPARGLLDLFGLSPEELEGVRGELEHDGPVLRRLVEDRAFASWSEARGMSREDLERARRVLAENPQARLWEVLITEDCLELERTPSTRQVDLGCPACALPLAISEALAEHVVECPLCGVQLSGGAGDAGDAGEQEAVIQIGGAPLVADDEPTPAGGVSAEELRERARWIREEALARWAINDAGAAADEVEAAREGDLSQALVEGLGLDVELVMNAIDDSRLWLCSGCGVRVRLGQSAGIYLGTVPCPGCGVALYDAQQALVDDACALWAREVRGLPAEQVEEARAMGLPLAEALVMHDLVGLDAVMQVLEPSEEVRCQGCQEVFPLGAGFLESAPRLRCTACGEARLAFGGGEEDDDCDPTLQVMRMGPYRLLKRIGRGGMGEVHQAVSGRGELVAVKVLDGRLSQGSPRERFELEARILEDLQHPNIISVRGEGVDPSGRPWLALELIDGCDLARLLQELPDGRLAADEACFVLAACARALAAAHAKGVIHRDLKPSNVMLDVRGRVKLTDFGIALTEDVSRRLTADGEVMGTPLYVPPEVLGMDPWSPAGDVYSLGSCAYRALTGRPAYEGGNVLEVLEAQREKTAPRVDALRADVAPEVADMVSSMMARDPAQRPDLERVAELLERFAAPAASIVARWSKTLHRLSKAPADESSQPDATLTVGQRFRDYELEGEIGRGGMGVVFRARHTRLNKTVALKVLLAGTLAKEEDRRRFLREAESAASLQHPGIVPVLDAGEHEQTCFMSMELVDGEPLSTYRSKVEPPRGALPLFIELCDAVHHAHSRGVIHRDLKPDNILVDEEGHAHVLDFGIAKRIDAEEAANLTTEGQIIGTLRYMPPEQAAGKIQEVDVRSDIYALGSILYELVCGRTPFRGAVHELINMVLHEDPRAPSTVLAEVPWELDAICLKALEKSRDERYQSALEMRRDIERFLSGEPITARRATAIYRARKWVARNRAKAGSIAAACVLALGLGSWAVLSSMAEETRRQEAIVTSAREGWQHFALREYTDAARAFGAPLQDMEVDDVLPLPPEAAGLLPDEVRQALPPDERDRPRVTRDRLAAWVELAEDRIQLQQANRYLEETRQALQAGRLEEARRALIAARLLVGGDDPDVQALASRAAAAFEARAEAALDEFEGLPQDRFDQRLAAVQRADEALLAADEMQGGREEVRRGLVRVGALRDDLGEEEEDKEALIRARGFLAEAEKVRAEAEALIQTAPEEALTVLQQARGPLLAASRGLPDEAQLAQTELALQLGHLALDLEQPDVARPELGNAQAYGLLPEQVAALEERFLRQDRRAKTLRGRAERGEALYRSEDLEAALRAYDLALELVEEDEEQVGVVDLVELRRRRQLCAARLWVKEAEDAGDLLALRRALQRAVLLPGAPPGMEEDLQDVEDRLYTRALDAADQAFAATGGDPEADWGGVIQAYERALRYRLDGVEALRGREEAYAVASCPPDMVLVSLELRRVREGAAAARLDAGVLLKYYVERREVSNADFAAFVAAGGYAERRWWSDEGWAARDEYRDRTGAYGPAGWVDGAPPAGREDLPVTGVSLYEARAYARWRGRRLLSEEEWEVAACRDSQGGRTRFPWTNELSPQMQATFQTLRPVGQSRVDESAWGVEDMAFNASEWTLGPSQRPVVRGLSAEFFPHDVEQGVLDWRKTPLPGLRNEMVGFRCARDVDPAPPLPPAEDDQ